MDDIPDKECFLNLSAASVRSHALSRDDGYFSRTGESLLEEQETQPAQPENLSQVRRNIFIFKIIWIYHRL